MTGEAPVWSEEALRDLSRKELQAAAKSSGVKANLPTDEIIRHLLGSDGESSCCDKQPATGDSGPSSLPTMSRAQLQALAKKAGIKANHKTADLIRLLSATPAAEPVEGDDAPQSSPDQGTETEESHLSMQESDSVQPIAMTGSEKELFDVKRSSVETVDNCDVTPVAESDCNASDQPENIDADDSMQTGTSPDQLMSRPWARGLLERVGEARKALRTSLGRSSLGGELVTPRGGGGGGAEDKSKQRPPSIMVGSPMVGAVEHIASSSYMASGSAEDARSNQHAPPSAVSNAFGKRIGDQAQKRKRASDCGALDSEPVGEGFPICQTPTFKSIRAEHKKRKRISGMCASIIQMAATPSNTPARPLLLARRPMQPLAGQGQESAGACNSSSTSARDNTSWSSKAADAALCGAVCAALAEEGVEEERERASENEQPRRKSNCRTSFGIKGTAQRVLTPHGAHTHSITLTAPATPLARASFGGGGTPRRSFGGDGGTPRSGFKAPWRI